MKLRQKIPLIYHGLIPELLDLEYPEEKIASCDNCTVCLSSQSPFLNTKCCSYHPHLPNYLVGGILNDQDLQLQEGKKRIFSQINSRIGVTPYAIIPGRIYAEVDKELKSQEFWKRPKSLLESQLCPYFDKGNCSVWKYRENLCVTFFCSSVGGGHGKSFWNKLNQYLKMIETDLSQYTMFQLGWAPEKIKTKEVTTTDFQFENSNGEVIEENYLELWGEWAGREAEFYVKCYEIIRDLDLETFRNISGGKRLILEAAIREMNLNFNKNVLPDVMVLHPELVISQNLDGYVILSNGKSQLTLPSTVYQIIKAFDGKRKTSEVFQLSYRILFNLDGIVNELLKKNLLIKSDNWQ
jgi:Fe-S-cluster containining protein